MNVKFAAVIVLLLCGLIAASQARAGETALAAPIEQCIRDNAVKVSSVVPNLNEAVDFLVDKVCAKPIADDAAAQQAVVMKQYSEQLRKNCDAWKSAHPNADTASSEDDEAVNPCQLSSMTGEDGGINWMIFTSRVAPAAPPAAVALAAQLLLDLRLAHTNQNH